MTLSSAQIPVQHGQGQVACASSLPTGIPRLRLLLLAVSGGLMLYLSYFPMSLGWLGWVALVPFIALIRIETRPRRRYFYAWLLGTIFLWPAISWMTVADYRMIATWAMLCTYCSLYFPLCIFLVRRLDQGTPLPLLVTFPVVWVGMEFVRCFALTGFPWYLLAHTQHDMLYIIQISDLGGAFLVGFLVAAVNVLIFEALTKLQAVRTLLVLEQSSAARCCQCLGLQCGIVTAMLATTIGYGAWRLSEQTTEPGPRVALLQGSIDQRLRIDAERSPEAQKKVMAIYQELCEQAAKLEPKPDLIVWPETSYPHRWMTVAPSVELEKQPQEFLHALASVQADVTKIGPIAGTNVLVGVNCEVLYYDKKRKLYNSALLIDAQGFPVKRYDKIHRVPFGEFVPLRDVLPFMDKLAPYEFDYSISQGDGLTRMPLGGYTFGVLICNEETDPFMGRNYGVETVDGKPVDFLVGISNDGWFDGSSEHDEHLAISRFRAIETRRSLARSVNMGISAVIDSNGRVLAPAKRQVPETGPREVWDYKCDESLPISEWRKYKKTEGVLVVNIPIDHRTSFYAQWGDWLGNGCWIVVGVGLVWSLANSLMRRSRGERVRSV